ncbi:MAG TPA: hypothetical protein DCM38_14450, partial [Gammaproteobacteria bacterium]|nr:hypothetical protein [Gammaproteobacteria bacterium]
MQKKQQQKLILGYLKYIRYKAADIYLDEEPVFSFPISGQRDPLPLSESKSKRSSTKRRDESDSSDSMVSAKDLLFKEAVNLDSPYCPEDDILLKPEDIEQLQLMVLNHETTLDQDEILDLILLVID